MKNKARKFIAGLCLTLLIPVFIGGQLDRPAPSEGLNQTSKAQAVQALDEDFTRIDMEQAVSILP